MRWCLPEREARPRPTVGSSSALALPRGCSHVQCCTLLTSTRVLRCPHGQSFCWRPCCTSLALTPGSRTRDASSIYRPAPPSTAQCRVMGSEKTVLQHLVELMPTPERANRRCSLGKLTSRRSDRSPPLFQGSSPYLSAGTLAAAAQPRCFRDGKSCWKGPLRQCLCSWHAASYNTWSQAVWSQELRSKALRR